MNDSGRYSITTGKADYRGSLNLAVIYTFDGDDIRDLSATEFEIFDSYPNALIAKADALDRARLRRELGEPLEEGLAESENYRNFDVWEIQGRAS